MSGWNEVFLGVIAVATLALAIVQVGVFVIAGLAVRRVTKLIAIVEDELRPIFGHVNAIARDTSRATALATAQVERADQLFADLAARVDQALNDVQASLAGRPGKGGRCSARSRRRSTRSARPGATAAGSRAATTKTRCLSKPAPCSVPAAPCNVLSAP